MGRVLDYREGLKQLEDLLDTLTGDSGTLQIHVYRECKLKGTLVMIQVGVRTMVMVQVGVRMATVQVGVRTIVIIQVGVRGREIIIFLAGPERG